MTRIELAKYAGAHLALRSTASDLFEDAAVKDSDVIVDFAGVRTMGRAFAHEYIVHRRMHQHDVTEVNQSDHVRTMFRIVLNPKPRPLEPLIRKTKAIVIGG